MASIRLPAIIAVPLCVVGGLVWVGQSIARETAKPRVTVTADAPLTVEVLDDKQTVEASIDLGAGETATLEAKRGPHTIRSKKRLTGETQHEVAMQLRLGDQHAVPTSADQCFAVLNISAWYRSRFRESGAATVEHRATKSEPYLFGDETYGRLDDAPKAITSKEHPKYVTAYPCSKIAGAMDSEIEATIPRAKLPRFEVSPRGEVTIATPSSDSTGADFMRLMSRDKPAWTRLQQNDESLSYRNAEGDFLIVATSAIRAAADMSAFVANIDSAESPGVFRSVDLLPNLRVSADADKPAMNVGGIRVGYSLKHAKDRDYSYAPPGALLAIGGDLSKLAMANAKARYADAAAKCAAKLSSKPVVCADEATEATAIALLMQESNRTKTWMRLQRGSLQVMKAGPKAPTTGFGDPKVDDANLGYPDFFTLDKGELKRELL